MKRTKFIIILVISLVFLSCHSQNKKTDNSDYNKVIKAIIEMPDFQNYLHPEISERSVLYIIKDDTLQNETATMIKKINIIYKHKNEINSQNYIEFNDLNILNNEATFNLYYKIENIEVSGSLYKKNDEWIIRHSKIIEF